MRFFAEVPEEPWEVEREVVTYCGTKPLAKDILGCHKSFFF